MVKSAPAEGKKKVAAPAADAAKVAKKKAAPAAAPAAAAAGPAKENKKRKKSEPFQIVITRILKRLRADHQDKKNTKLLFRPEVVEAFRDLAEANAVHLVTSATEYNKNHLRRKNMSAKAIATVLAANLPNKKLYTYCTDAAQEAEAKRIAYRAEHAEENKARWAARQAAGASKGNSKGAKSVKGAKSTPAHA